MLNTEIFRDIFLARNRSKGECFLRKLEGKAPLFVCIMGTTETAKIKGISAAGQNSELTDYTPPADVELLLLGKCRSIRGVPITPDGIPTPALITMCALNLSRIPAFPVNGGSAVKPRVPFLDAVPAPDARAGRSAQD